MGNMYSVLKSAVIGCAVRELVRKVGKEALQLDSNGRARDIGGLELMDAPSWGLVRNFFLIVLVACSDTLPSFGISSEYPFLVRKIVPSELCRERTHLPLTEKMVTSATGLSAMSRVICPSSSPLGMTRSGRIWELPGKLVENLSSIWKKIKFQKLSQNLT